MTYNTYITKVPQTYKCKYNMIHTTVLTFECLLNYFKTYYNYNIVLVVYKYLSKTRKL